MNFATEINGMLLFNTIETLQTPQTIDWLLYWWWFLFGDILNVLPDSQSDLIFIKYNDKSYFPQSGIRFHECVTQYKQILFINPFILLHIQKMYLQLEYIEEQYNEMSLCKYFHNFNLSFLT